jgi:hypothetical protein
MSAKGVLQEHMIFQKTRTQSLLDVRALNMWGYELENVSIISQMTNAETLSLPVNKISTLAPFESCRHLQQLLLRDNQISSFDELHYLEDLPCLTTLSLINNPITQRPNYRETVIRKLPRLRKLDDIDIGAHAEAHANAEVLRPQSARPATPRKNSGPEEVRVYANRGREVLPRRSSGGDANMLAAVLSLIPELSPESLHIVLEAIEKRCQ